MRSVYICNTLVSQHPINPPTPPSMPAMYLVLHCRVCNTRAQNVSRDKRRMVCWLSRLAGRRSDKNMDWGSAHFVIVFVDTRCGLGRQKQISRQFRPTFRSILGHFFTKSALPTHRIDFLVRQQKKHFCANVFESWQTKNGVVVHGNKIKVTPGSLVFYFIFVRRLRSKLLLQKS